MTGKQQNSGAEGFLAPLSARLARLRGLEAAVFWESGGWPDAPAEILEPEEIVFYLEGLVEEGFCLEWRLVGLADAPAQPDHLRIYVWENGAAPPGPEAESLVVIAVQRRDG